MTDIDPDREFRQWAMALHLSQFANLVIPFAGLIAPLVIWQMKKDEFPKIDDHGRTVVNWVLSAFVYALVGAFLIFIVIGIALLIALGIASIAFPIIGAIKASDGALWKYPFSIPFLRLLSDPDAPP